MLSTKHIYLFKSIYVFICGLASRLGVTSALLLVELISHHHTSSYYFEVFLDLEIFLKSTTDKLAQAAKTNSKKDIAISYQIEISHYELIPSIVNWVWCMHQLLDRILIVNINLHLNAYSFGPCSMPACIRHS